MASSGPQLASAGPRLAQTKDILLPILNHLDSRNVTAILTTSRTFLWLGHDVLGRRTQSALDKVLSMDPKKINHAAMLDSIRTINVPKTIQCELRQPKWTRFSPSDLEVLRKKCRNLRRLCCDTGSTVSPIRLWDLDIDERIIRTSEVVTIDHCEGLSKAYLARDMQKVWKGYTVTRSIKLILEYRELDVDPRRGIRTGLLSCDDEWLRMVAQQEQIRSIGLSPRCAVDSLSTHPMTPSLALLTILKYRKIQSPPFAEIEMRCSTFLGEFQRLVDACAGTCSLLVCVRDISDGPLIFKDNFGPPAGTTLRIESIPVHVEPTPLPLRNLLQRSTETSPPAVEILNVDPDVLYTEIDWSFPHLPQRFLTVLDLGVEWYNDDAVVRPPDVGFLKDLTKIVCDDLPVLKKLRFIVCVRPRGQELRSSPLYSWPGQLEEVVAVIQVRDKPRNRGSAFAKVPYFTIATCLACLCADPGTLRVKQQSFELSTPSASANPAKQGGMNNHDLQELVYWLISLNPGQQRQLQELDFGKYGLFPIRPEPYTWRNIAFNENDQLVPLEQCVLVDQVRSLRETLDVKGPKKAWYARWALDQIRSKA